MIAGIRVTSPGPGVRRVTRVCWLVPGRPACPGRPRPATRAGLTGHTCRDHRRRQGTSTTEPTAWPAEARAGPVSRRCRELNVNLNPTGIMMMKGTSDSVTGKLNRAHQTIHVASHDEPSLGSKASEASLRAGCPSRLVFRVRLGPTVTVTIKTGYVSADSLGLLLAHSVTA